MLNYSFDTITIKDLKSSTTYYWQVKAKFQWGDNCSANKESQVFSFKTIPESDYPYVITAPVATHTHITARIGGLILDEGASPVTDCGIYYSKLPNSEITGVKLSIENRKSLFSKLLSGLDPSTNYYIKAYAANNKGIASGEEVVFYTEHDTSFNRVKDIEGNIYYTVKIGPQEWKAENLKTTKFNDGTQILYDNSDLPAENSTPSYCWYNNDAGFKSTYGALYNQASVLSSKNLCPAGWHIPSATEWKILLENSGSEAYAAPTLRETGNFYWTVPEFASNKFDFSAMPGGSSIRTSEGLRPYRLQKETGSWWSLSKGITQSQEPGEVQIYYNQSKVWLSGGSIPAYNSIRCLKN